MAQQDIESRVRHLRKSRTVMTVYMSALLVGLLEILAVLGSLPLLRESLWEPWEFTDFDSLFEQSIISRYSFVALGMVLLSVFVRRGSKLVRIATPIGLAALLVLTVEIVIIFTSR